MFFNFCLLDILGFNIGGKSNCVKGKGSCYFFFLNDDLLGLCG